MRDRNKIIQSTKNIAGIQTETLTQFATLETLLDIRDLLETLKLNIQELAEFLNRTS